jgi:hypothetical protein
VGVPLPGACVCMRWRAVDCARERAREAIGWCSCLLVLTHMDWMLLLLLSSSLPLSLPLLLSPQSPSPSPSPLSATQAAGHCIRLPAARNLFEPQHDSSVAGRQRISMGELDAAVRASLFSRLRGDAWARESWSVQRVESVLSLHTFMRFRKALSSMRADYGSTTAAELARSGKAVSQLQGQFAEYLAQQGSFTVEGAFVCS